MEVTPSSSVRTVKPTTVAANHRKVRRRENAGRSSQIASHPRMGSGTARVRALLKKVWSRLTSLFLHYVIDEWFETQIRPRLSGDCTVVRFADDAVMAFDNLVDAQRVLAVLGKRLERFGLTLHPDKTRLVDFRPKRAEGARHPATGGPRSTFSASPMFGGGRGGVRAWSGKSRPKTDLPEV
jgi:hypothetical protein